MYFLQSLLKSLIFIIEGLKYLLPYIWSKMLISSLYTMLKLSNTTSPNKLFDYDCVTLYYIHSSYSINTLYIHSTLYSIHTIYINSTYTLHKLHIHSTITIHSTDVRHSTYSIPKLYIHFIYPLHYTVYIQSA